MTAAVDAMICAAADCDKPATGTSAWIELLGAIVRGVPKLDNAACIGRHAIFTSANGEDIAEATTICTRCPALDRCHEWADKLRRNKIHGVIAGQYYEWTPTPNRLSRV